MSLLFSTGAIAGSAAKGAPGMVLLTPTSIAHSGTSASIGANGQVTFSAVTSLSLNGVFSADFDNYQIYFGPFLGTNARSLDFRLRASGSDATAANYTRQFLLASLTTVAAGRSTSLTYGRAGGTYGTSNQQGTVLCVYGPYLAQPTATRTIHMSTDNTVRIDEDACTHSLSTAYDGITFSVDTGTITGVLAVYGIRS